MVITGECCKSVVVDDADETFVVRTGNTSCTVLDVGTWPMTVMILDVGGGGAGGGWLSGTKCWNMGFTLGPSALVRYLSSG